MDFSQLTTTEQGILKTIASALFEQDFQDINDLINFREYRHCISIDLGGGNCSAASADLQMKNADIHSLKIFDIGEPSIWSMVGYDALPGAEKETISAGLSALNRAYQYSNYKTIPIDDNLTLGVKPDNDPGNRDAERTVESLTKGFLTCIFDGILDKELGYPKNRELIDCPRDKILVIVGHPTSERWKDEKARKNLENMVKEATGVGRVLTMAESNAAILYAMKNSPDLGKAAKILIIDLGATTADITYIDKATRVHKEASMELGGKQIDFILVDIAIKKYKESGLDPENILKEAMRYPSRIIKEKHWPKGEEAKELAIKRRSGGSVKVELTPQDFRDAVTSDDYKFSVYDENKGTDVEASYAGHLIRFLEDARDVLDIRDVDWVLVTGGAARMTPAREVIRDTAERLWGVNEGHIWPQVIGESLVNDAVPHGCLLYYLKAQQTIEKLPDLYGKLKTAASDMTGDIAGQITEDLMPYLMDEVVLNQAEAWKASSVDCSFNDLQIRIKNKLSKDRIKQISASAVLKTVEKKKAGFQKIITDFLEEQYGAEAKQAGWKMPAVSIDTVDFAKILSDAVAQAIEKSLDSILNDILAILMFVLLPLVLIGLLVWAGLESLKEAYVDNFYTEEQKAERERALKQKEQLEAAEAEKKEREEKAKPRSAHKRKKAYKEIEKDETREKIRNELKSTLRDTLRQLCDEKDAFGIPEAYLNQLVEDIRKSVYSG